MGRQLFLHHYLPAHLASALVTGALIEFVFNIEPAGLEQLANGNTNNPVLTNSDKNRKREKGAVRETRGVRGKIATQSLLATWAATGAILSLIIWSFFYFAPLTYGKPGLDVQQVVSRKWLNYDLHFAK